MTADPFSPLEGHHVDLHTATITVVVRCGFIGCPWRMEIGTAPLEAHAAYIEHLDVHDPDHVATEDPDCEATEPGSLYAGDSAEQIAAEQARIDRFMARGEDR